MRPAFPLKSKQTKWLRCDGKRWFMLLDLERAAAVDGIVC